MEFLQDSLSVRYPEELGGQPQSADPLDRLREYTVDPCEDLLKVKGDFVFKAYDWPEIVNRIDDEEKAYRSWKEQEAQLRILMSSKPERPIWLYPEPKAQPFYRSIWKELIIAGERAEWPKFDQLLWEIRRYAKRSSQSLLPGGPLELQKKGNYNELLDLCLKDLKELPVLLPEDQKVNVRLYNRSIVRYMNKFFVVADEIDEKPIWGNSFLAQQHRKSLGFPDEEFNQCRNSPANKDDGDYFLEVIKGGKFCY